MLPLHLMIFFQWINRFSRSNQIMQGKKAENKLSLVPLSDDVVKSRINDIGEDILSQVVADSKASPTKFSIQLDETTNVANFNRNCTLR